MPFNPYRSARNRRWHPKFSLSPRDAPPVASAAITGSTLSPSARLMAEGEAPTLRVAAPSACFTSPVAAAAASADWESPSTPAAAFDAIVAPTAS